MSSQFRDVSDSFVRPHYDYVYQFMTPLHSGKQ